MANSIQNNEIYESFGRPPIVKFIQNINEDTILDPKYKFLYKTDSVSVYSFINNLYEYKKEISNKSGRANIAGPFFPLCGGDLIYVYVTYPMSDSESAEALSLKEELEKITKLNK